jgi:hypothetical protein
MEEAIHLTIRTVQIEDVPFLWDMIYEAAAVAESMRVLGKEKALSLPMNRKYIEEWGRPGDAEVLSGEDTSVTLIKRWIELR